MIASEAAKVLGLISSFDNRPVSREHAESWAMVLHDVPVEDALEAVRNYFKHSSGVGLERLMPRDIIVEVTCLHTERRIAFYGGALMGALDAGATRDQARAVARAATDRELHRWPLADLAPLTIPELEA